MMGDRYDTANLLARLRSLPPEDSQSLLTAYTEALAHLGDDQSSLMIFLDYVAVASSMQCCDMDELGYVYWFMKGKLRAHRLYWEGYLRFEVELRSKPFELIFTKVMDWLRVKDFPGKEALMNELQAERESLMRLNSSRVVSETSESSDISYISKKMKDLSSNMGTPEEDKMICDDLESQIDNHLNAQIYDDKENRGNREHDSSAKNPVCELEMMETTENLRSGKLRFSPNKTSGREPYSIFNTKSKAKESPTRNNVRTSPMASNKGVSARNSNFSISESIGDISLDNIPGCPLLEDTQTFRTQQTFLFKNDEILKINRIGKGGSSVVYKILHHNEIYALKQIRIEDKETKEKCLEEIKMLQKLNSCDFVIKMMDFEISFEFVNIILEYGETDLLKLINTGPLDIFYVKYIWRSILKILLFIHQNRIVHRDIKPANFVLVRGVIKLIDFGISKSIRADTTSVINIEKAGTLNYISPEQCSGGKVSRSTDMWAAGCILYYMIYNRHILPAKNIMSIIRYMGEERAIEYPSADHHAVESMRMCLQYDPKKRAKPEDLLCHQFLSPP